MNYDYRPLESTISERIRKAIAEQFPGAICRKRHVTMGLMGDPDLYGSLPGGRHFEIEVKRPGGRITLLQKARLEAWRTSGAITGVAHSVEEAMTILRKGGGKEYGPIEK